MISLVKATELSRLLLKRGGVVIILILIGIFLIRGAIGIAQSLAPKEKPKAQERFGMLTEVPFRGGSAVKPSIYTLNTITGGLAAHPQMMKVYRIKKKEIKLHDLDNIRKHLLGVGFGQEETKISDIIYQWGNKNDPQSFIKYNIISGAFEIHSDFMDNQFVLDARNLPPNDRALGIVMNFLSSVDEYSDDYDLSQTKYSYYKIENQRMMQVDAFNEAQLIKVELFQKPLEDFKIHYPSYFNNSIIRFILASGKSSPVIVAANYRHQETDYKNPYFSSTYNIKSPQQAFEDLKNNKALIFNIMNKNEVEITKIYLGYYIGDTFLTQPEQDYIVPIVIYEGNNFKAYVHAIPENRFAPALSTQ
jgi:hypothetical protein